jgi:hypothetical protein
MSSTCDKLVLRASRLVASSGQVKKFTINKEGRIRLQIDGDSFFKLDGKLMERMCKGDDSSLSSSCVDAVGLVIIKKFFPFLLEYLSKLEEDDYNQKLVPHNHVHFTIQILDNNIEFSFHLSLLHDMMLENLNVC